MDALQASKVAKTYFESIKSPSVVHGFSRYILTNGQECLIVDRPDGHNWWVFRCEIRNGETYIELSNG